MKWFRIDNRIISLENVATISLDPTYGMSINYRGEYCERITIPQSKARYAEDRAKENQTNYEKLEKEFNRLWDALEKEGEEK